MSYASPRGLKISSVRDSHALVEPHKVARNGALKCFHDPVPNIMEHSDTGITEKLCSPSSSSLGRTPEQLPGAESGTRISRQYS